MLNCFGLSKYVNGLFTVIKGSLIIIYGLYLFFYLTIKHNLLKIKWS